MTSDQDRPQNTSGEHIEQNAPPSEVSVESPATPEGFTLPLIRFISEDGTPSIKPPAPSPVISALASQPAIREAELLELSSGTGKLLYYPLAISVEPGDVFYLRERSQSQSGRSLSDSGTALPAQTSEVTEAESAQDHPQTENGIIVQVIKKETATYSQADSKVLWRLLTSVRAQELQRAHYEPAELIDLFLAATFKVRAAIVNGEWQPTAGQVVTRNVDIFAIDPSFLLSNILSSVPAVNVHLGDFKGQAVAFSGQGFDKVNLITGMKGGGKSHITKGILNESRQRKMPAVVFDINDEYRTLPGAVVFRVGEHLKFRLDRIDPRSFLEIIQMLSPFGERTAFPAAAGIRDLFEQRFDKDKPLDIAFLKEQADVVFPKPNAKDSYIDTMRTSYTQSLSTLETFNLFATAEEIRAEDKALKQQSKNGKTTTDDHPASTISLSSAFYNMDQQAEAGIVVFSIGGLLPDVQRAIVKLALDTLIDICDRQTKKRKNDQSHIPIYPTVVFRRSAHVYGQPRYQ